MLVWKMVSGSAGDQRAAAGLGETGKSWSSGAVEPALGLGSTEYQRQDGTTTAATLLGCWRRGSRAVEEETNGAGRLISARSSPGTSFPSSSDKRMSVLWPSRPVPRSSDGGNFRWRLPVGMLRSGHQSIILRRGQRSVQTAGRVSAWSCAGRLASAGESRWRACKACSQRWLELAGGQSCAGGSIRPELSRVGRSGLARTPEVASCCPGEKVPMRTGRPGSPSNRSHREPGPQNEIQPAASTSKSVFPGSTPTGPPSKTSPMQYTCPNKQADQYASVAREPSVQLQFARILYDPGVLHDY